MRKPWLHFTTLSLVLISTVTSCGGDTGAPRATRLAAGDDDASGGSQATATTSGDSGAGATNTSTAASPGDANPNDTNPSVGAPTKFVGNITTRNACDTDGKIFSKHWDQITPENAGKWGSVQSYAGGAFNWATLDAIYDYARTNSIIFKQHAFVWGKQQPGGTPTEAQIKTWMTEFCSRYPLTKLVDVVNEPPPHTEPNYVANMGGGTNGDWAWVANAFKWAREACPNAILLLNDFNNIEWPNETDHFIEIVKAIQAAGAPVDALGAQAHDLDHAAVSMGSMKPLLEKLHDDTGLPVYITELDISTDDDQMQLAAYKSYIPYFMQTEWIHGITIWGWIYGKTWSAAPQSGLVRDGAARPAMTWLMQYLNRPVP